jgi:hypothetical protein
VGPAADSAIHTGERNGNLNGPGGSVRQESSLHRLLERLPTLHPQPSWKISPDDITIVKRPDGSDWLLGTGAYGQVALLACCSHVQVALSVTAQAPSFAEC